MDFEPMLSSKKAEEFREELIHLFTKYFKKGDTDVDIGQAFLEIMAFFSRLMDEAIKIHGRDASDWYTKTLKKCLDMFEGKGE